MYKKIILIAIVLSLFFFVFSKNDVENTNNNIKYIKPEQKDIVKEVIAFGKVHVENKVNIGSEITGRIDKVYISRGNFVKKGALLATIDSSVLLSERGSILTQIKTNKLLVKKAKIDLDSTINKLERLTELHRRGLAITQEHYELLTDVKIKEVNLELEKNKLEKQINELNTLDKNLAKTNLISPLSGVVTDIHIKEGETVIAGSNNIAGSIVFTIVDLNNKSIVVNVDESDIRNVSIGQKSQVFLNGNTKIIQASVLDVHTLPNSDDNESSKFKVILSFSEEERTRLIPGINCRVHIKTLTKKDILTLPISSILFSSDKYKKPYIYKLSPNKKIEKVFVKLGISNLESVEILDSDLSESMVALKPKRVELLL